MKKIASKKLKIYATKSDNLFISRIAGCFFYPVIIANPLSGWKKDKLAPATVNLLWQYTAGLLKGKVTS